MGIDAGETPRAHAHHVTDSLVEVDLVTELEAFRPLTRTKRQTMPRRRSPNSLESALYEYHLYHPLKLALPNWLRPEGGRPFRVDRVLARPQKERDP
jgi:hypothetical protein